MFRRDLLEVLSLPNPIHPPLESSGWRGAQTAGAGEVWDSD